MKATSRSRLTGFRSTFREWVELGWWFQLRTLENRRLAHAVGNKTVRSYRRADNLEARRPMMAAWGAFCMRKPTGGAATGVLAPQL